MQSISVGLPTEVWAADIAYMPLSSRNNRYLLMFMDYMTKWVVTTALPSCETSAIANVMLYSKVLTFGAPKRFITDNGKNFISEAMMVVCKRLGIKKVNTSVEHPQSDGMVERMNRTIKAALSIYCEKKPEQWDAYLPFVTFGIHTTKLATTGKTPYEVMFGRKSTLPSVHELSDWNPTNHTTKQWIQYLNHYIPILYMDVKANIQKSLDRQQRYFNKNRKQKEEIKIGDKVLEIKMKEQWKFAEPKFTGP
ncbi:hypothetical protein A0J61_10603 [Choanephora cucurbitarum]|uniref:Integrase catalytic domain-containing protein n=1 Tax=Choanephora cucurbitarum TaxID=101091 RepID=A0A1C7MX60_9FUNG|nr:hypothetical protein A0J61_10603 [Choanephora cucurbitarum]